MASRDLKAKLKRLEAEGVHLPGDVPAGVMCWHIHHHVLLEITTEPLSKRVEFIYQCKSPQEIPVRLEWMRPVWGELPKSVVAAGKELWKARKDDVKNSSSKSLDRVCQAGDDWDKVVERCRKSIEKLHAQECPGCPWDGETLFPTKRRRVW